MTGKKAKKEGEAPRRALEKYPKNLEVT